MLKLIEKLIKRNVIRYYQTKKHTCMLDTKDFCPVFIDFIIRFCSVFDFISGIFFLSLCQHVIVLIVTYCFPTIGSLTNSRKD